MKGLNKFINEINAEVEKVADKKKKKLIQMQAEQLINHLNDVCDKEYDDLLIQPHKTFRRMWEFIVNNAREYEVDGVAFVSDPTVFGWMDEYVGLDDKDDVENAEKEKTRLKTYKVPNISSSKTKNKQTKKNDEAEQVSIFDLF